MALAFGYYRRYRNSDAEKLLLLAIVAMMVAIAFYAFHNYLMTGSFGILGAVKSMENRVRTSTKGLMTFFGSLFGMLIDGLAGFSGAVVSAALAGSLPALVYLSGYGALVGVMLWNFISSGKFVR